MACPCVGFVAGERLRHGQLCRWEQPGVVHQTSVSSGSTGRGPVGHRGPTVSPASSVRACLRTTLSPSSICLTASFVPGDAARVGVAFGDQDPRPGGHGPGRAARRRLPGRRPPSSPPPASIRSWPRAGPSGRRCGSGSPTCSAPGLRSTWSTRARPPCTCPSRWPTTSTSTRRSTTPPTWAACSGPTPNRSCPTGVTSRSDTTGGRARSWSAERP